MLFEHTGRLVVILVAVQFGLVALWSWRRTRGSARTAVIGLVLIPALVLLNRLVVTPTERITGLCIELATLVDEGDVPAIAEHLAKDFHAGEVDRARFLERLRRRLADYRIDDPRLRHFEVTFPQTEEAVAVFDAVCRVRGTDAFFERLLSRWRLTFRRRGGRWRVTRIEALPAPFSPIRDLRGLIR